MKKKILGGIAGLAIAVAVAWNVNLNAQKCDLSDIAMVNVEALASESGNTYNCPGGWIVCVRVIYPGGETTYYKQLYHL
jgi:hypothetical protein